MKGLFLETMDIAVAAVASSVSLEDGKIASCRIALAAVGPTPIFAEEASKMLLAKNHLKKI